MSWISGLAGALRRSAGLIGGLLFLFFCCSGAVGELREDCLAVLSLETGSGKRQVEGFQEQIGQDIL